MRRLLPPLLLAAVLGAAACGQPGSSVGSGTGQGGTPTTSAPGPAGGDGDGQAATTAPRGPGGATGPAGGSVSTAAPPPGNRPPTPPTTSGGATASRAPNPTTARSGRGPSISVRPRLSTADGDKVARKPGLEVRVSFQPLVTADGFKGVTMVFLNDTGEKLTDLRILVDEKPIVLAEPSQGTCGQKGGDMACELTAVNPGQTLSIDLRSPPSAGTDATFLIEVRDADGTLYTGVFDGPLVLT